MGVDGNGQTENNIQKIMAQSDYTCRLCNDACFLRKYTANDITGECQQNGAGSGTELFVHRGAESEDLRNRAGDLHELRSGAGTCGRFTRRTSRGPYPFYGGTDGLVWRGEATDVWPNQRRLFGQHRAGNSESGRLRCDEAGLVSGRAAGQWGDVYFLCVHGRGNRASGCDHVPHHTRIREFSGNRHEAGLFCGRPSGCRLAGTDLVFSGRPGGHAAV